MFIRNIIAHLIEGDTDLIERATVAKNGSLGEHFKYLQDYVDDK